MKQYKNYWTTNNHLSKSLLTNTAVVNPELLKDFSDAEKWLDEEACQSLWQRYLKETTKETKITF